MAVDVIFEHRLLHVVADHRAERTHSVALLVLLQLLSSYEREALLAVTAHQRLLGNRNRRPRVGSGNKIGSGLCFKSATKINCKQTSHSRARVNIQRPREGGSPPHEGPLWSELL